MVAVLSVPGWRTLVNGFADFASGRAAVGSFTTARPAGTVTVSPRPGRRSRARSRYRPFVSDQGRVERGSVHGGEAQRTGKVACRTRAATVACSAFHGRAPTCLAEGPGLTCPDRPVTPGIGKNPLTMPDLCHTIVIIPRAGKREVKSMIGSGFGQPFRTMNTSCTNVFLAERRIEREHLRAARERRRDRTQRIAAAMRRASRRITA